MLLVIDYQDRTLTFSGYANKHVILLLMMLLRLQGCEMGIFQVTLLSDIKKIAMKVKLMISVGTI